MTVATTSPRIVVRQATPADNAALIDLAARCPMRGSIGLRIDRDPDFFALHRLEGSASRVWVTEHEDDGIVGCVAAAPRDVWLQGHPTTVVYAGDFKVHPAHRGSCVADVLQRTVLDAARDAGDGDPLIHFTVLDGNRAMERRLHGPRGLPRMHRVATLATYSIPLLWPRTRDRSSAPHIESASTHDLEAMAALWARMAPGREFAPRFDADTLHAWIRAAPSLSLEQYLVARDARGNVTGFLAWWDQRTMKTLRVVTHSVMSALVSELLRAASPMLGSAPPPRRGEPLHVATVLHACVPSDRPGILRALLLEAYRRARGADRVLLNITLDVRDPLGSALHGLLATRTTIGAYAMSESDRWARPRFGARPVHFEAVFV